MVGYIYIINQRGSHLYKVGRTKNTKRRIKQLQTGNPKELVYKKFFSYKGKEHINNVEKHLHKWLDKNKIKSEWFYLKPYKFYEKRIEGFITRLNAGSNIKESSKELEQKGFCIII